MKIPLVDLQAQYRSIRGEIDRAMASVIDDAAFISGPYVKSFEAAFASYCGSEYAIGVSNGTDALRLALLACGVRQGDEVITVPNTFIATAEAIGMIGARVRFVDVEPLTGNINAALVEAAITPRTRAIVPVHLYGRPADMDPILEIAWRRSIRVIGDAAQAHGAVYKKRKIGLLGDAACFSFYPGKNLGAYGDAGAVVTNDSHIANAVSMLRDHGRAEKYEHAIEGFNCRMDGLQGAVLSAKLPYLDEWTAKRRHHAAAYDRLLADIPGLSTPPVGDGMESVYHLYVVRAEQRAELAARLATNGIATGVHYPIPLHRQPAYASLQLPRGSFPIAERLSDQVLSLPMYPELTDDQLVTISQRVKSAMAEISMAEPA